jgi:hypothetical protein
VFEPGPGEDEAALAGLLSWVQEQPGVLGVISAWTEIDGRRSIVLGLVVDGDADQQALRAEGAGVLAGLPAPHLVESFAPSRGLTPPQLRLYRGSTRLWTRRVERAPTSRPDELKLDTTYHGVSADIDQILDTSTVIDDEHLDGGVTLVGLDLNTFVQRGPEAVDERDTAVVAWVRDQPHTLAVLRAMAADGDGFPVYSVLVDADADRSALRRGVAVVVAGTGADRFGVEVFCPFERIEVFHVQLFGTSLSLWKADQPAPSTQDDLPAGDTPPAGTSFA